MFRRFRDYLGGTEEAAVGLVAAAVVIVASWDRVSVLLEALLANIVTILGGFMAWAILYLALSFVWAMVRHVLERRDLIRPKTKEERTT